MRGEDNHKIPGSFAPENMEKTGAERVKYSLACQHEDAISIKFVSYAQKCSTVLCTFAVALRKESVDRNCYFRNDWSDFRVALRKESVDRNLPSLPPLQHLLPSLSARRAWIEIVNTADQEARKRLSLSARRAWIEIRASTTTITICIVALRKESVDRNDVRHATSTRPSMSLSARRAWIEIALVVSVCNFSSRRSPQGERG